jgi:hypothetical protein
MAKSRKFNYKPTYEETVKRAERKTSGYASLLKDAKIFKAAEGDNVVRVLPPSWKDPDHYGYRIWVHNNVGPKDQRYLCLRENPTSPHKRCPICEELSRLGPRATTEDRQLLSPREAVLYYIVDREKPKEGVQVWMVSPTAEAQIAAQTVDKRRGNVLNIIDPDDGYDLSFMRQGMTKNKTRYLGYKVDRDPSPLSESERSYNRWLDEISERPLPSLLNFYTPDQIEEELYGKGKDDDDDDRPRKGKARSRDDDEDEDEPRSRSRSRSRDEDEDEDEPRKLRKTRKVSDEDEDEEEEKPKKKARARDDDEDEDESPEPPDVVTRARKKSKARVDEEDEEEEDEKPARKSKSKVVDDDEDEEDEPPVRKRRTKTELEEDLDDEIPFNAGRRGRKPSRDEDDDEEEDDEKPRKKAKAKDEDEDDDRPTENRRNRIRERMNRG